GPVAPLQIADAMARPQSGDGALCLWLRQGDRHLPRMRVGVQYHLVCGATFETAKHRQAVTTEHRWAYRWSLFHFQATPIDMHILERRRVHTAEHPEHLGFNAFARVDKFCRPMRGAG